MNIIERYKEYMRRRQERRLIQLSREVYQAKELDGELWLTHNGSPVLPASKIYGNLVDTIKEMRNLFVERNKNEP